MSPSWRPRPSSTFRTYLTLQVPGWVLAIVALALLQHWLGLSLAVSAAVLLLWIAKDLALYPFLGHAYAGDPRSGGERLVGERGVAVEPLAPAGLVRVRGELWRAEIEARAADVGKGAGIEVCAARGLTLIVRVTMERQPLPTEAER